MFERFTERARMVVVFAQDEARLLGHNYIGTEHLLLGLLREDEGFAAHVLATFNITVDEVRTEVARIVGRGDQTVDAGPIPFTPRSKKVLELALREALSLDVNYIGTEHVLLGIVRENEGIAMQILDGFDADAESVRNEILGMLSGPSGRIVGTFRHVAIACPACGHMLKKVLGEQANTKLEISAESNASCPGCGREWRISYTVSWHERPEEGG